jgi:hypothetical protein
LRKIYGGGREFASPNCLLILVDSSVRKMETKNQKPRRRFASAGHVHIAVRGDPEFKKRLEDFMAFYRGLLSDSEISRMICEFALYVQEATKSGAEVIIHKEGRERKLRFPPKLTWEFSEE